MKKFTQMEYNLIIKFGGRIMFEWDNELEELLKSMGAEGSPIDAIHKKLKTEFEKELNIGFIGSPGVGKSTLMNKIAGKKIADAGIAPGVEVTKFAWGENNSIIFWDLPGYNGIPEEHGVAEYWEAFEIEELDIIVCMFSNKLNEHDVSFFKKAIERSKDVIFVRSKADDLYDEEIPENELKNQIENTYIKDIFGAQHKLLFISVRKGYEDTLDKLQEEITGKLNKEFQEKYTRNAKAYSKSFLDEKEKASLKTVLLYSTVSASVGAVPIAGIAIDIPANIKMVRKIGENFILTERRLQLLEEGQQDKIKDYNIYLNLLKHGVNAKHLYVPFLEKIAPKLAGANFAKFAPIVGAGLGFSLTFYSGKQAISTCREIAEKIMDKEIQM